MSEICVFAGTTEGRKLLEFLAEQDIRVQACVATKYGETLVPRAENIHISTGRLDRGAMKDLFTQHRFDLVVDATHPFATEVTGNILGACADTKIECIRLNRDSNEGQADVAYVDSIPAAARFLAEHPGNALLATGSKELAPYTAVPEYQKRLYPRVLPTQTSLEACAAAGFSPSHIIAIQGPFSLEMNVAMLKAIHADWLVTKDSGDSGGYSEKLEAARKAGARCIVIGRPKQPSGMSYAQVVGELIERFALKDNRRIDIIGIGMGARETLTFEAQAALGACDVVIGAPRMLEAVAPEGKRTCACIVPDKIAQVISEHPEYRRVAVVMSGDSGFFSGTKKLLPLLKEHSVRVLPGLSSMQVLCARLQTPWDDVRAVSLHGREGSVVPEVIRSGKVFALTSGKDAVQRVCADLCDAGLGDAVISVGQRLSYPDEVILRGRADELIGAQCAPLSALLIERTPCNMPLPIGLPDGAFLRQMSDQGRTVPMTKSEVRAVSISKLQLHKDAVVWDVGAGTGSVSVEAALLCTEGHVYAVECREDAAELISRNAQKFALRNLTVVRGTAPEALEDLPAPTHVFIGGSSGKLRESVDLALSKNPCVRIVVNAITMESAAELTDLIHEKEIRYSEVVQLFIARSRRAGHYHLMEGLNPIWITTLQNFEGDREYEG